MEAASWSLVVPFEFDYFSSPWTWEEKVKVSRHWKLGCFLHLFPLIKSWEHQWLISRLRRN